jgi:hypothetical protein
MFFVAYRATRALIRRVRLQQGGKTMSSRSAIVHAAGPRTKQVKLPVAGHSPPVRAEAAANDDKPTSEFSFYSDPLFGMAAATVILFAVLAALIALG